MKKILKIVFSLAMTILFIINYIKPIDDKYILFAIVLGCIYIIFVGKNIKFGAHLKNLVLIYVVLFTFILITDKFFVQGVYSIYNNLMLAITPPIWIISLYS